MCLALHRPLARLVAARMCLRPLRVMRACCGCFLGRNRIQFSWVRVLPACSRFLLILTTALDRLTIWGEEGEVRTVDLGCLHSC
ncbi:hypothetical protein OF83DRAFT_1154723 [Amylostereum chailletii]|nr:hypothetical protein OF83DRAFT_1154723 [Amylostereum chailletii]